MSIPINKWPIFFGQHLPKIGKSFISAYMLPIFENKKIKSKLFKVIYMSMNFEPCVRVRSNKSIIASKESGRQFISFKFSIFC